MIHCITLLLFNIVYFLCNTYPKHIVEISGSLSVVAIIFNFIYYILFALFIFVAFNKNHKSFFTDFFSRVNKTVRRIVLSRVLLICALQVTFDILTIFAFPLLNDKILYVNDLLTVLGWIGFYIICADKDENIFLQKSGLIVGIILAVMLFVTGYGSYEIIKTGALAMQKHTLNATTMVNTIKNLDFLFEAKNFFLDTMGGVVLFTAHALCSRVKVVKKKNNKTKQVIRFILVLICSFILVGIKSAFLPAHCISGIDQRSSETQNNTSSNSFYANTKTTVITRIDSNLSKKAVFQNTKNQLFYGETLILEYYSNDTINANTYEKIGNQITVKDCFEKVEGEVTYYLYKNEVICFLHNGIPVAIHFEDLQEKHNEYVTAIYKSLIKNNNWNFFEQGAKYLLKHDNDFIKPYLQRFSVGDFKQEELETLNEMSFSKQYIQSLSQNLTNTH